MLPFRSEIRNSPSQPTIKIFLSDESLDSRVKKYLEDFSEVAHVEIRESIGRNRADENITVFLKDTVDIRKTKSLFDSSLQSFFEENLVD